MLWITPSFKLIFFYVPIFQILLVILSLFNVEKFNVIANELLKYEFFLGIQILISESWRILDQVLFLHFLNHFFQTKTNDFNNFHFFLGVKCVFFLCWLIQCLRFDITKHAKFVLKYINDDGKDYQLSDDPSSAEERVVPPRFYSL